MPRDRLGDFEPKILKKHQTALTEDMEAKIISMYSKGMSTSDIEDHIRDLYGVDISDTTISRITDKIREWQSRPLDRIYAMVFMDANVRTDERIIKKAVYVAIGVNMDSKSSLLGAYPLSARNIF